MHTNKDFENRVVLITGGSTGIGRAAALTFAKRGANIVIGDIDDRAEKTVELVKAEGVQALFKKTDVADAESVQALVDFTIEKFGRLDHAFNNAGVLPRTKEFTAMTDEDFDLTIGVDLKGVFYTMRSELKHFEKVGKGTIVNTASVAGLVADPGMAPYVAAKHGVVGLTKAAGIEYIGKGIRVNAIAPGLVETPMTKGWLDDPKMQEIVLAQTPIGRPAKPVEIANMVVFLSSDEASFTAGQVFTVDAGQTAH
ncbi:SDR family NAD(P)-dependent oxidoreductase [Rummeliibacillus sp. NPDC094406]|uniref:SDR family NAD(P)-dependent oxidoreductase n=1 Tax=Rummeliibacillus sp. NPDC094406 TaxID=3364511 RepID=UPI00381432A1